MRIKQFTFLTITLFIYTISFSQSTDTSWKKIYRATPTKINDLVHTRLDVKLDFNKSLMYGKEWITLHPHFYSTDSLSLDAKGLTINEVSLIKADKKIPLVYKYDSTNLFITLDKMYKATEQYIVYIDYVVKPDYTILDKPIGLFFVNPKGDNKNEPTHVWTQGEPESNSAWFPTIDKPDQKSTEEINITAPDRFVTMSNGLMVAQKNNNNDGTRTDSWKMNEPNAPYLFFVAAGDYVIIKDKYKNKEVSYYVYKQFASTARKIFGITPEEITFFSKITGVDYPWEKYAQIVCKNAGGFSMENTSCTMHSEIATADERDLTEINWFDQGIAHELFHQWFGDYVTCESWSNLTLNESFATLGEALWNEYKHGKDNGEATMYSNLKKYLSNPDNVATSLVHFYYPERNEMNDISYAKGACILNMLRNYVGDSAFFKSLNIYLTEHKYGNAEAQDLRLAFEQVTGEDLNWFWNEWYYNAGHPKLDISYTYDDKTKTAKAFIKQTQTGNIFQLPLAIDVYEGTGKKRYKVWMKNQSDTFSFSSNTKPLLINVDADKTLVCEKTDNKTLDEFIYQYKNAGNYIDRSEAVDFTSTMQTNVAALNFLKDALHDKSAGIKIYVMGKLNMENDTVKNAVEAAIKNLITDSNAYVRANAIDALSKTKNAAYKTIYLQKLVDSSYSVVNSALLALAKTDSLAAETEAIKLAAQPARGALKYTLYAYTDENKFDSLAADFNQTEFSNDKFFSLLPAFANYVVRLKNTTTFEKGVDVIVGFRESCPDQFKVFTSPVINNVLKEKADEETAKGFKERSDYIMTKLPEEKAGK